ncbi:hypothetical protein HELRODRAFT_173948 [Helobdella robusta]|uniref:SURP motif domain-containing protein n=1 Tax=Helobdella robusta TaxID=6412 RepID=T1F7E6_HELRO|nr:hypothetical protein HELRODRAFT_173948 [Helobdella robusta]ESO03069.1 hypothetical protein HELRODRAFT_173948 [Helobdella robusta]
MQTVQCQYFKIVPITGILNSVPMNPNDTEEEMKRLNEASSSNSYYAVSFDYGGSAGEQQQTNDEQVDKRDDSARASTPDTSDPYIAHPSYLLPDNILLPDSMKMHTIIEKTASFISSHGGQMEVIMRTKQKNNPQFNFLTPGDALNEYYKHMLSIIKNKQYLPLSQQPSTSLSDQSRDEPDKHVEVSISSQTQILLQHARQ